MTEERCGGRIYDSHLMKGRPCSHRAKVTRNGKPYCGVHDPERLGSIRKATQERWKREAEEKEERRRQRAMEGADALVQFIVDQCTEIPPAWKDGAQQMIANFILGNPGRATT